MKAEKIKREDIKMATRQEKQKMKARIMALVLAGLMVFTAVAGVLIYFIK